MKTYNIQAGMRKNRNEPRGISNQESRNLTIRCESPSSPVLPIYIYNYFLSNPLLCYICPEVRVQAVTYFHPSSLSLLLLCAISACLFLSVLEVITFFQLVGCEVNGSRNKSHQEHFGGSLSMQGHWQLPLATSAISEWSTGCRCSRTESEKSGRLGF